MVFLTFRKIFKESRTEQEEELLKKKAIRNLLLFCGVSAAGALISNWTWMHQ